MKGFGILLIIGGLVCAGMGIYGFYGASQLASESVMGISARDALALIRVFGAEASMSFTEKLALFSIDNRVVLLIGGIIATIAGGCLKKVS